MAVREEVGIFVIVWEVDEMGIVISVAVFEILVLVATFAPEAFLQETRTTHKNINTMILLNIISSAPG